MAAKAKIYTEENYPADADLIQQLQEAIDNLKHFSRATKSIFRSGRHAGYGVDKLQRSIAADSVMSITRAIKSKGGW